MARVLHADMADADRHAAYGEWQQSLNAAAAGDPAKRPYTLAVANALWGQKGFGWQDSFLKLTNTRYGASLSELDFMSDPEAARKAINLWVEDHTQKHIKDLLASPDVTPLTRMVLTNAVYFQGKWADQFDPKQTFKQPFHTGDGGKVDAAMMHRTGGYKLFENESLQALELPYRGGEVSMVVLLPRKADGLADLEKSLSAEKLAEWIGKSGYADDLRVTLPKFTTTSRFDLGEALKKLGMTDAFDPAAADFSGLTEKEKLAIAKVIHKAFVQVDEEGTKAAAATAVVIAKPSPPPPSFTADHPFTFVIRDTKTGGILFMGRITDPTK
jgi:serpin B